MVAPHPLFVFFHGYGLRAFSRKLYFLGVGSTEAEDHAAIGMHFGRNQSSRRFHGSLGWVAVLRTRKTNERK